MFKKFIFKAFILVAFPGFYFADAVHAQFNIRPYSQVYSENLRGSVVLFGNTSMNIVDADTISTIKTDETNDPLNPAGGVGYSQYGNDGENMQFADIDITPADADASPSWKYLADGSDQGTAWRLFNDPGRWASGVSSFGYGHAQQTTINGGIITTYFVKTLTLDPSMYSDFNFIYSYDDGIVIYVNGIEVTRNNMPAGIITAATTASAPGFTVNASVNVPANYFVAGANIIAVEIHQDEVASTSAYFDMRFKIKGRATYNSSSADLILPTGTNTIKFARLYWGGRIDSSSLHINADTLHHALIRKGTAGPYTIATAPPTNVDQYLVDSAGLIYQAYVDITSFVQSGGAGTYTIADIPGTPGASFGGGEYAGWSMVIAYENTALNYNSVRIYDGFTRVYDFGIPVTQSIELTGLNVPDNPLTSSEAVMSTMVWEGDANLYDSPDNPAGDYLKLNDTLVTNAVNPVSNFWNGSISKNGVFVTGVKNPDHYNQMGIDIDEMNVGTGYNILPNATTVRVEFGTEADQYFPSVFTFSIRMKEPSVTLDKTVEDANNNGFVDANEILTYTLSGANSGSGIAFNTVVTDSLPVTVSYVPNSLEVVNAPGVSAGTKTDIDDMDDALAGISAGRNYVKFFIGNNWTSSGGGELPPGANYALKFKVQASATPGSIVNTARIMANSQAGDLFVDDGTAVIAPMGGPVDIKLHSFTAELSGMNGLLKWVTESEWNNDHFEIERSDDAVKFVFRGAVAGSNNSSGIKSYSFVDPLNSSHGIIYYRLKTVDTDGRIAYSKIIALRLNNQPINGFTVYPNPFTNDIKIFLTADTNGDALFRLITFEGKEVLNRKLPVQPGDNIVVLKDIGYIASGSYLLEITAPSNKSVSKIIKK